MLFDVLAPFYNPAARLVGLTHEPAVRLLAPRPEDLILDVGGGTGIGAHTAARLGGCRTVIADRNWAMLRRVPRVARVAPVLADATALPLPDASCDGALCLDALHHFRDPRAALREIARVLRPGRRLVIEELDASRRPVRALGHLEALFGEPGRFWAPRELAALVAGAGFRPTEVRVEGFVLFVVAVCQERRVSPSEVSK